MLDSTLERRADQADGAAAVRWPPSAVVALALGIAVLCALFAREFRAAIEVWNASTAYGHCYLIVPMTIYLLWDRRAVIQQIRPTAEWRWAVLGLPIAAVWLVAERLGVMEGRQLAAIAAFELLFLVVLGRGLFDRLSGPLLYLVFLVPFGAFVTPALQHFTADFTVLGLRLLGIPYYSDGFIIETPSGTFLVAEACAGLRFLIAAVAFGVFYALVSYRSPMRRLAYVGLSIVVPIVANGFRAFGIVFLGQILGSAEAAAADHLVYGWIFFSIVMLLLVAVGHTFRERSRPADPVPLSAVVPSRKSSRESSRKSSRKPSRKPAPIWGVTAVLLAVAVGPAVAGAIDHYATVRPFAGPLGWASPDGCSVAAPLQTGQQDAAAFSMVCRTGSFRIGAVAYSSRSTSRPMVADRRLATRELGAEDVTSTALGSVGDANGEWTVVQTTDPDGVTAYAAWVDGRPAEGGIKGRVLQARESLLGASHQPMLLTITAVDPGRLGSAQRRDVLAQIRAIVAAQTRLTDTIDRISDVAPGR